MKYVHILQIHGTIGHPKFPLGIGFIFNDSKHQALGYLMHWETKDLYRDLCFLLELTQASEEIEWGIEPLDFISNHLTTEVSSQVSNSAFTVPTIEVIQLMEEKILYRLLMRKEENLMRVVRSALSIFFQEENRTNVTFDKLNEVFVTDFIFPVKVFIAITPEDYQLGKNHLFSKVNLSLSEV